MEISVDSIYAELGIHEDYHRTTKLTQYRETPIDLVSVGLDVYGRPQQLRKDAAAAWFTMQTHAKRDDVTLQLVSAFRSIEYQAQVIRRLLEKKQTIEDILTRVAAPGYSEHQSGCAVDLTTPHYRDLEQEFEDSAAFQWLTQFAGEHQFKLSYPPGNDLGVIYEPWHWCFHTAEHFESAN